jgi:hypothetical protein
MAEIDDAAEHDRRVRMRARRAAWIARFRQRQADRRNYINLGEVVMWAAGVPGGFKSREVAYDFVIKDLREGRIQRLLCLHPDRLVPLTGERMELLVEMVVHGSLPKEAIWDQYLDNSWMQQTAFEVWRVRYNLPEAPAHFRSRSPLELAIEEATDLLRAAYGGDRHLKNDAARALVARFHLTEVEFKNVRGDARELAGLPRMARAGAKPKLQS